jgi:exosortase
MLSTRITSGLWALIAVASAFTVLYGGVFVDLVGDWQVDDNYSHGFLIIPASAWLAWERRVTLTAIEPAPSAAGLILVLASLGLLLIGTAGVELFITRVSMIGVLAGAIVYLMGWAHLRALAFPLALLLLMIPLPAIIFNQIAFPLQLLASQCGVNILRHFGIPVLREGNVIVLANSTLEVAQACSGIRSLVSLFTLTLLYGHFSGLGTPARVAILVLAVPIVIVTNGLRVAATGLASHHYGTDVADGVLHDVFGWLVFIVSFALVVAFARLVRTIPSGLNWQATRA